MQYTYKTKGTCATQIEFEIEDDVVSNVKFTGGCDGNLQAIPILVEGENAKEVIKKLRNIKCGVKSTSCADQLAEGLAEALEGEI